MESVAGFAHEAVLCAGILHKSQALAGGIGFAQGIPNRLTILSGNQRISGTEHTGEPRLNLGQ